MCSSFRLWDAAAFFQRTLFEHSDVFPRQASRKLETVAYLRVVLNMLYSQLQGKVERPGATEAELVAALQVIV